MPSMVNEASNHWLKQDFVISPVLMPPKEKVLESFTVRAAFSQEIEC
jgi:hypothetical protein